MNIYHWYSFKSDPTAHSMHYFGFQKGGRVKITECRLRSVHTGFLPPAYEVRGKVMFWHESVCLSTLVGGGYPIPGRGVPPSGLDGGGWGWRRGWGVPQPGLDGGGYPSQVWMVGGTLARSGWWGVPHPWGGGYPSHVWMVGGYPGHVWMVGGTLGTPWARSGWWGTQVPPHPPWLDGVPPPPPSHQHSKHLLRGRLYASCVHAGGLSC